MNRVASQGVIFGGVREGSFRLPLRQETAVFCCICLHCLNYSFKVKLYLYCTKGHQWCGGRCKARNPCYLVSYQRREWLICDGSDCWCVCLQRRNCFDLKEMSLQVSHCGLLLAL